MGLKTYEWPYQIIFLDSKGRRVRTEYLTDLANLSWLVHLIRQEYKLEHGQVLVLKREVIRAESF